MATPDETKLQKGALAPAQQEQTGSQKAVSLIESLAAGKPSLPTGSTISPVLQNVKAAELMPTSAGVTAQTTPTGLAANIPQTAAAPTIAAPTTGLAGTQVTAPTAASAAQMTAQQVLSQVPTMTAATGTLTQPMQAAQGTVTTDATVPGIFVRYP